jgi:uncharacterized protein involved in exopolysaccharide biosynthesis
LNCGAPRCLRPHADIESSFMTAATPFQWWNALQSRKALVLATVASACATAVVASLVIKPIYEGQVQFYVVEGVPPAGTGAGAGGGSVLPIGTESTMSSYVALMQSVAVRRRVIEQVRERDAGTLSRFADVSLSKKTTLLVRVLDPDPKVAAALANAYPVALEQFLTDLENDRRTTNLVAMKAELESAAKQADDARAALAQFLSARATSSLQREQELELTRAQQLQTDLSTQQARLASLDQRIAVTASQIREELMMPVRQLQTLHPGLNRLARELADQEVELAAARAEFDGEQGLRHPKVRMLQARINEVRQQLSQDLEALGAGAAPPDMLREQLRRDLLEAQRQRVVAISEIASRSAELSKLRLGIRQEQSPRLEEQRLAQQVDIARQQANTISRRMADLQAEALRKNRSVVILGEAEVATQPKFPSIIWNVLISSILGLIAGIYLALISSFSGRARAAARLVQRAEAGTP